MQLDLLIGIPESGIPCPTCGVCNAYTADCKECLENAATELRLILLCGMSSDIPAALELCAILKPHTVTLPVCKGAGSVAVAGVTLESWNAYPPFAWNEPVYPRTSELALAVWEALGVTFNL